MHIDRIYAQMACGDLAASEDWYARFFGREPDATPMDGLAEWHHGAAGLQLFRDAGSAGHTTVTLVVSDLGADRWALIERGLDPGEIERADYVRLVRLRDPDGNLVVLAEPDR